MAVADTRGSKRRKLSPAEEETKQRSKRKSQSEQDVDDVQAMNGHDMAIAIQIHNDEMPSVKGLDSSEPAIRRSTMKTILEHLQTRTPSAPFTSTQCLQLWRGFFVAIYMHDSRNALSVQNLLREIAGTFSTLAVKDDELKGNKTKAKGSESVQDQLSWLGPYHSAFWETVSQEWAKIDSHRMNKYLLLVRFVLRQLFTISMRGMFKRHSAAASKSKSKKTKKVQDEGAHDFNHSMQNTQDCIKILETDGPLNPSQRKISDGLRLHVLDVWSDELFGALNDLEEEYRTGEDKDGGTKQHEEGIVPILLFLRDSVEKVSKSDSGAQRHIRLRAKDAIEAMNEQMEAKSMEIPVQ